MHAVWKYKVKYKIIKDTYVGTYVYAEYEKLHWIINKLKLKLTVYVSHRVLRMLRKLQEKLVQIKKIKLMRTIRCFFLSFYLKNFSLWVHELYVLIAIKIKNGWQLFHTSGKAPGA